MKLFLGITPRSWSWALAFTAGSYVGPAWDRPIRYLVMLIVIYEDGYRSISPKKAFEDGYRRQ